MLQICNHELHTLQITVTKACNYSCRYCREEATVLGGEQSPAEIESLAAAVVAEGIHTVRLVGGEPLLRPDILEICRRLRTIPQITRLIVSTNASRLGDLAKELMEAGVTGLEISMDSMDPKMYRRLTRSGTLADAVLGVSAAVAAGFEDITLNVVLIGGCNEAEIPQYVHITKTRPWTVRFVPLCRAGECATWDHDSFISTDAVLQACPELELVSQNDDIALYRAPGSAGTVCLVTPQHASARSQCGALCMDACGKLHACQNHDVQAAGCTPEDHLSSLLSFLTSNT